jgi:hypothetical protein
MARRGIPRPPLNRAGNPLKHFLPEYLRSQECLFASGLGDVKAGML